MDMAQEMFEKNEEISLDNFDKEDPKKIKLNKPNNLIMKKCLIDELGFSNLRTNGYMPVYNYYRKDDKLIIRIEAPGNCELKTSVVKSGEYNYIKMEGVKRKDKEPAEGEEKPAKGGKKSAAKKVASTEDEAEAEAEEANENETEESAE